MGRVYCGRKCQVIGSARDGLASSIEFARRPLHAAWVIAIIACASALLLAAVGVKVGELIEVSRSVDGSRPDTIDRIEISADVVVTEGGLHIDAQGPPRSAALLLRDGHPLGVVTFDDDGHASSESLDPGSGEGPLWIVPLPFAGIQVMLPTPTETPLPTATPEPSPTPTPRPTADSRAASRSAVPTPMVAPPVLQLVQDAGPRIAITFDGNASTNRTAELLDLLQQHDLEVTIFVTGQFIERYPSIIRRAVLAGHEIGNHTYSHPHLTTYAKDRRHRLLPEITRESFQRELQRTEEAFAKATGHAMQPLWRSPYGEENRILRGWALEMGYLHVRWSSLEGASLDSRDWVADEHSSMYQNSSTMMERLLRFPELRGGIVLMHLATTRNEPPWEELPTFVESLRKRGVEPTTVVQLLESSPTWRPWLNRARARHRETFER